MRKTKTVGQMLLIAIFVVVTRNFCKIFVSKISNNSLHNFSCGSSFLFNQVSLTDTKDNLKEKERK